MKLDMTWVTLTMSKHCTTDCPTEVEFYEIFILNNRIK